jgi:hypothetical protein
MANAAEFLTRSQNADGGWGYRVGGMSFVEPTSAALVALSPQIGPTRVPPNASNPSPGDQATSAERRGRDFLVRLQHADGGWGVSAVDDESGWMTAWAVLALTLGGERTSAERGVSWLLATQGLVVDDPALRALARSMYNMDSTLRGWPWLPNDAAWVHPTALAVIGLVAAGRRDEGRVEGAIAYLLDRSAAGGGWNVGNPEMLGKVLPPTIQDTAVALVALQMTGQTRDVRQVVEGIDYMRKALASASTPAELAWGACALNVVGGDGRESLARLNVLQQSDGSWQGNPFVTAIAALANRL